MVETKDEAELGRNKQNATPREHLVHLLTLGWEINSPLIQKFVRDNQLQKVLEDWINTNKK